MRRRGTDRLISETQMPNPNLGGLKTLRGQSIDIYPSLFVLLIFGEHKPNSSGRIKTVTVLCEYSILREMPFGYKAIDFEIQRRLGHRCTSTSDRYFSVSLNACCSVNACQWIRFTSRRLIIVSTFPSKEIKDQTNLSRKPSRLPTCIVEVE